MCFIKPVNSRALWAIGNVLETRISRYGCDLRPQLSSLFPSHLDKDDGRHPHHNIALDMVHLAFDRLEQSFQLTGGPYDGYP